MDYEPLSDDDLEWLASEDGWHKAAAEIRYLRAQVARLTAERDAAKAKWADYEQGYILPVFGIGESLGIDVRQLVRDNPGRNCVMCLIDALIADWDAADASARRLAEELLLTGHRLVNGNRCWCQYRSCSDMPKCQRVKALLAAEAERQKGSTT